MGSCHERRNHERHGVPGAIKWAFFNTSGYNRAEIVDYCKEGLAFQANECLRPGMNLTIKSEGNGGGARPSGSGEVFPTVKVAEVKWCRPHGDPKLNPSFTIGVRYHPGYFDD